MDNYAAMLDAAKKRFCTYEPAAIAARPGVTQLETGFSTVFLGMKTLVDGKTGDITVDGEAADFGQSLTVFDWLCDRKENAAASYVFCPVSSLPGVLVRGNGLVMNTNVLAGKADRDPRRFIAACEAMGGRQIALGDVGIELMVFPDLPCQIKFYFSDEEFPAAMTLLWDSNTLQFLRYESIYYLAGCLLRRIQRLMA